MTPSIRVRFILSSPGRPEREGGRFPFSLNGQVVVGGGGGVLVVEGSRRVRRISPGLLRVPDDAGLGFVPFGGDVQRLGRIGSHGGGRRAGGGRRRGGGSCGRGASGRRRVRLLVERAADAVHHGPPGRPGRVAGRGRWRCGGGVAGRAEAPDMVVRVQGGGGASHGGKWTDTGSSRASRAHCTARRPHTTTAHEKETRARFRSTFSNKYNSNRVPKVFILHEKSVHNTHATGHRYR